MYNLDNYILSHDIIIVRSKFIKKSKRPINYSVYMNHTSHISLNHAHKARNKSKRVKQSINPNNGTDTRINTRYFIYTGLSLSITQSNNILTLHKE